MSRYGGNLFSKVFLSVIAVIFALAFLVLLSVLIYCSIKGMPFIEGFKTMFSFLYPKVYIHKIINSRG